MTDSKRSKSSKNPSPEHASPKGSGPSSVSGSVLGDDPLAGLSDLPPLELGLKSNPKVDSTAGGTSRQDFMTQPPIEQVDDFEDLSTYQKKWELNQTQTPLPSPDRGVEPLEDFSKASLTQEAPSPSPLEEECAASTEPTPPEDTGKSESGEMSPSFVPNFGSTTSINATQFESELPEFEPLESSGPEAGGTPESSLSSSPSEGEILPASHALLDLPAFPEEAPLADSWQENPTGVEPNDQLVTDEKPLLSIEPFSDRHEDSQNLQDPHRSQGTQIFRETPSSAATLTASAPPSSLPQDSGPIIRSQVTAEGAPPSGDSPAVVFRSAPVPEEVPAGHPDLYTLVIEGNLSPEEREKLTDLVLRNDLGIREADLAIQFRSQQIFLPKLTEFTAVVIAQAMRAVGGRLRVFHASRLESSSGQNEMILTGQTNQEMNTKITLAAPMDHPAEQIPITQDQWIPDLPPEEIESVRVLSATAILNPEEVADAASAVYQARLESLCRELRFRAHFLGIHALVSFHSQLTPLSLSPHYRLTVSVNGLTRKSPKNPSTDEITRSDEQNL